MESELLGFCSDPWSANLAYGLMVLCFVIGTILGCILGRAGVIWTWLGR